MEKEIVHKVGARHSQAFSIPAEVGSGLSGAQASLSSFPHLQPTRQNVQLN